MRVGHNRPGVGLQNEIGELGSDSLQGMRRGRSRNRADRMWGARRQRCGSAKSNESVREQLEAVMKMFERMLDKLLDRLAKQQDGQKPVEDEKCPEIEEPADTCPEETPVEEPAVEDPTCTCPEEQPVEESPVEGGCEEEPVADPEAPVEETPCVEEPVADAAPEATKADFAQYIKELLGKEKGETVHEERFQYAIVSYLLKEKIGEEASEKFQDAFKTLRQKKTANAGEDATKAALQQLVDDGVLTGEQAEKINGLSFAAAQLDANEKDLYDGRGDTSAKAGIQKAIKLAWQDLESHMSGDMSDWPTRKLTAPSTKVDEVATKSAKASQVSSSSGGSYSQEFLWKPESEKEGKLVILLPHSYENKVASVEIYGPNGRRVSTGTSHGYGNGGREHFRFDKAGGKYPDNSTVVITLRGGEKVEYKIGETSNRYSK